MWLLFGICSSFLLGLWEVAKKIALHKNNVLLVLFYTFMFGGLIFAPVIGVSYLWPELMPAKLLVPHGDMHAHLLIMLKSVIVGTSWIWGYYSLKYLPITIVGPIKASRPIFVLLGAILIFGERLNLYQWIGVIVAITSLFLLSLTGRKEGIEFKSNKWILYCAASTVMGAISALFDKYLLRIYEPMFVQSWFAVYGFLVMGAIIMIIRGLNPSTRAPKFHWSWAIPIIAVIIAVADVLYFYALSYDNSMISVLSLIRRSSVIVSFLYGAIILREKNVGGKIIDLILMFIGLFFLALGSMQ